MEGHKYKGARLLGAFGLALDDGVSSESSGGDLLKHAARGVHDKHQGRDLLHTEEPVKDVCSELHAHTYTEVVLLLSILRISKCCNVMYWGNVGVYYSEFSILPVVEAYLRKFLWPTVSLRSLSTLRVASVAKAAASTWR